MLCNRPCASIDLKKKKKKKKGHVVYVRDHLMRARKVSTLPGPLPPQHPVYRTARGLANTIDRTDAVAGPMNVQGKGSQCAVSLYSTDPQRT